jgi:hypothetical protein
LRWADWGDPAEKHLYNVLTWSTGDAPPVAKPKNSAKPKHVDDGSDLATDRAGGKDRTADVFRAAPVVTIQATKWRLDGGRVEWSFDEQADFALAATLELPAGQAEPLLTFRFTPKKDRWFSVGYVGAPERELAATDELWQPMLWQEKRFPKMAFLTESARCPLPVVLAAYEGVVCGLVADPAELPFLPLPTVANSRFGVAVRNAVGRVQPTLFAPILGGEGSKMTAGQPFIFRLRLVLRPGRITDTYEALARGLYAFRDHRHNDGLGSLNRTLERTIEYALSKWVPFNEDLRAFDYEVPGSVKNVSALHPLSAALVTDDETIYQRRGRPILEYLLSREKFLFTTNPKVTGQNASSKLNGPCVPVSELTALYEMSGRRSSFLLKYAEALYGETRTLNLDAAVRGDIWQNALALYRATGDAAWLARAKTGADAYIVQRLDRPQTDFKDPASRGMFFWSSYAPNWIELFELFAATGERRYLDASREGARRFAQFIWMCPTIPDGDVLANAGGQAPLYRTGANWPPIAIAEELAPAWRLSEIGLTSESSGTCKGHRAIFQSAAHAAWMLRLALHTGDAFLHDIGRSAIVGRYTNFPGYHINTARSTAYEKPDFPCRPHAQLSSTTSMHYNHLWPHVAMLLDYLVADAEYCSRGAIRFPSHFAEAYAYFQERVYGDQPGQFYDDRDVWLWMPKGLLTFDEPEINFIAGRSREGIYLALMNQSDRPIAATLKLEPTRVQFQPGTKYETRIWQENQPAKTAAVDPASFHVEIAPRGITALAIHGPAAVLQFQSKLLGAGQAWKTDFAKLDLGGTHAMVLNFGPQLQSAYVYLQADGSQFTKATLHYSTGGAWQQITDEAFPFEFSVPLGADVSQFSFKIEAVTPAGEQRVSEIGNLVR